MNPAQLERLQHHLHHLRLFKSRERLEALLQEAAASELSYAHFLDRVLSEEVAPKTAKNIAMRISLARFPFVKTLETSDGPTSSTQPTRRSPNWAEPSRPCSYVASFTTRNSDAKSTTA